MTTFESNEFEVRAESASVADFLSAPSNLIEILPEDRIDDWSSDGDTCSFKIKGLAGIKLKLGPGSANEVVYDSVGGPFDFQLKVALNPIETKTMVVAKFDADVASMMAMMLKTPLTNFLNSLGTTLQQKFSEV